CDINCQTLSITLLLQIMEERRRPRIMCPTRSNLIELCPPGHMSLLIMLFRISWIQIFAMWSAVIAVVPIRNSLTSTKPPRNLMYI
ncbi:unnamed protein product, partial [Musa hybrid cultivar]